MSPVRSVRITEGESGERRHVKITRVYTGEDGNGHFEDLGDGEVRRFGPGDIFMLDENEHGRGHISTEIEPRLTAIAMLDPDMNLELYCEPYP